MFIILKKSSEVDKLSKEREDMESVLRECNEKIRNLSDEIDVLKE